MGDEARIDLSVACVAPSTRATQAGEETYNENKITHIDWFVFSSDDATATAIEHGRETFTDKDNVTEPFTVKSINMQNHVVSNACSGYVYVIANLPDEYSHDEAGIKHTEGTTTVTDGLTLGALKTLPLTTVFDVLTSEGKFQAQDKFVMASGIIPFNLTATEKQKTVDAKLSRVASKLTLDLSVVSAIDEVVANMAGRDTLYEEYKQTWYPDVENIHIYMSYANGHTTLDKTLFGGAPETYTDANFFTFTRDSFSPTATSQEDGWKLTGTPFYSYPMKWNTQDEHAPFIKIILPWRSYVETPSYETHNYINHEGSEPHPGNKLVSATRNFINDKTAAAQEFFYKLSIPAEDNVLESNTWYKISMDVAILGGRSDDLSMEMAGRYYVVDWYEDPDFSAGGALVQGSYLKLASDTYYIYGGNSIEIPVQSSHNITTTVTSVNWTDYSTSPNPTTSTSLSGLARPASTDDDGRVKFTFTHELMSDISLASTTNKPDVSEYTFTVRVQNSAGDSKTITIIQRPPLMIVNEKNTHTNRGYVFVNNNTSNNNSWDSVNGTLGSGGDNNNPNMYIISSSIVPSGFILADPRSSTVNNINGGDWSSNQGNRLDTGRKGKLTNYHPTLTDELGKTKIAPKIRIASSFGKTRPGTFTEMQQRCASYQEFGYPAGRWRVPTKAEIEFMITLSNAGVIPSLFTATNFSESHLTGYTWTGREIYTTHSPNYYEGGYFTADGGVLYPFKDGDQNLLYYLSADELATHSGYETSNAEYAMSSNWVRCVYDEWYWGSDKISNSDTFTWGDIAY